MLRGTAVQQFYPAVHGSAVRKTPCPIRMKRLCMQPLPLLEPETDARRILFPDRGCLSCMSSPTCTRMKLQVLRLANDPCEAVSGSGKHLLALQKRLLNLAP